MFPPGKFYGSLSEGVHSFSVQAFDPSGQGSSAPQRTVTIVDTAITNGPAALVNSRTATFNYSTVAGNAFECSVDFAVFEACGTGTSGSKTVTVPTDGPHNFRVRAQNGGVVDAVPASRNWTVETVRPSGTIKINGGKTRTRSRSVILTLSATDPAPASGVGWMRFRNKGTTTWTSWKAYATLKSWTLTRGTGTKTVYVKYKDRAGNISAAASDSIVYRPLGVLALAESTLAGYS